MVSEMIQKVGVHQFLSSDQYQMRSQKYTSKFVQSDPRCFKPINEAFNCSEYKALNSRKISKQLIGNDVEGRVSGLISSIIQA